MDDWYQRDKLVLHTKSATESTLWGKLFDEAGGCRQCDGPSAQFVSLMPGESLMIPGGMRHNETATADELELLEVSVPAEMKTVVCEPPAGMG